MSPAEKQQFNRSLQEGYRLAHLIKDARLQRAIGTEKQRELYQKARKNLDDLSNLSKKDDSDSRKLIEIARNIIIGIRNLSFGYVVEVQFALEDARKEINLLLGIVTSQP
jgi:hypothetical protein